MVQVVPEKLPIKIDDFFVTVLQTLHRRANNQSLNIYLYLQRHLREKLTVDVLTLRTINLRYASQTSHTYYQYILFYLILSIWPASPSRSQVQGGNPSKTDSSAIDYSLSRVTRRSPARTFTLRSPPPAADDRGATSIRTLLGSFHQTCSGLAAARVRTIRMWISHSGDLAPPAVTPSPAIQLRST